MLGYVLAVVLLLSVKAVVWISLVFPLWVLLISVLYPGSNFLGASSRCRMLEWKRGRKRALAVRVRCCARFEGRQEYVLDQPTPRNGSMLLNRELNAPQFRHGTLYPNRRCLSPFPTSPTPVRTVIILIMPFTLSHAAAALPFRRTRLIKSALVIGCFAPDFEYFIPLCTSRQLRPQSSWHLCPRPAFQPDRALALSRLCQGAPRRLPARKRASTTPTRAQNLVRQLSFSLCHDRHLRSGGHCHPHPLGFVYPLRKLG